MSWFTKQGESATLCRSHAPKPAGGAAAKTQHTTFLPFSPMQFMLGLHWGRRRKDSVLHFGQHGQRQHSFFSFPHPSRWCPNNPTKLMADGVDGWLPRTVGASVLPFASKNVEHHLFLILLNAVFVGTLLERMEFSVLCFGQGASLHTRFSHWGGLRKSLCKLLLKC